ncbi:MAG TPA: class I SAM-dependent methyltransferase [Acidimicrobiales bacterium]|nr:class I SAM-dependent methyltransferase [Acidimicrobiales bacterium]
MERDGEVAAGSRAEAASGRGEYGIDGGAVAIGVFGVLLTALASTAFWAYLHRRCKLAGFAGLAGLAVAASAADYLYSSGSGKRAVWSELLDELDLRGDEDVLDVGCGRGAVLMAAAHRVPEGRAVGADLWRRQDQSGNSRVATEQNALVEGVRDRVEVVDADARDLPFPPASFDLVTSSLMIHNIKGTEGRNRALSEIVRVLRAGGRLRIVDFPGAGRYAEVLREAGCVDISVRRLDWRTWFGIPGHHLRLVLARKSSD